MGRISNGVICCDTENHTTVFTISHTLSVGWGLQAALVGEAKEDPTLGQRYIVFVFYLGYVHAERGNFKESKGIRFLG